MARAKDTSARVTRWFLVLQDFQHRAGASNGNADGLSRLWSGWAGLSGNTPLPPQSSPLSYHRCWRSIRSMLGGGGKSASPWEQRNQHLQSAARDHHQHLTAISSQAYNPGCPALEHRILQAPALHLHVVNKSLCSDCIVLNLFGVLVLPHLATLSDYLSVRPINLQSNSF